MSMTLDMLNSLSTVSRSFMPRALRILSLMLIALWISGTQHCELIGAGIIPVSELESQAASCGAGGCEQLQNVSFGAQERTAKVAAPVLRAIDPLLFARVILLAGAETAPAALESFARPLPWVADWYFARRMAPPSRAPDSILA